MKTGKVVKIFAALMLLSLVIFTIAAKPGTATSATSSNKIDMKILLICADGTEPSCDSGRTILQHLGTPYTELDAATQTMTAGFLSDGGSHAYYAGVLLSTGDLAYNAGSNWTSAFSTAEWQTLHDFEVKFSLREASLYSYPTADAGLTYGGYVDTSQTSLSTTLTPAGQELFHYLNPNATITVKDAWSYLSQPTYLSVPTGAETTPLLVTGNNTDKTLNGYSVASLHHYSDGRESLTLTLDNNPNLIHAQALLYGIVDWVSKGLLLGERHVFLSPGVDDMFIPDDQWDPATNTTPSTNAQQYRNTAQDINYLAAWEQGLHSQYPNLAQLKLNLAFNGSGTPLLSNSDTYGTDDPLTDAAKLNQSSFIWTNHTYDHENLDKINAADTTNELQWNDDVAKLLGFTNYTKSDMVPPDISGLQNSSFLSAASSYGLRYLVSDTSVPGEDNPSFNTGIVNLLEPSIYEVPRYPTEIYYNTVTPAQETSEYNNLQYTYWGKDLSYQEIMDNQSDQLVDYMLNYDIDPLMFHISDLGLYDQPGLIDPATGHGTLITDLLNETASKYNQLFNLPVETLTIAEIGKKMQDRAAYNGCGAAASTGDGAVDLSATASCTVPVTGLASAGDEHYGGEDISYVPMSAGGKNLPADSAPQISNAEPFAGSTVNNGRPHITTDYDAPAWGVDTGNTHISLDGQDVTASAAVNGNFVSYVPAHTLSGGLHTVSVSVTDNGGHTAAKSWQFTVTTPNPALSVNSVFWGSYSDYQAGKLSVTFSLKNKGTGTARTPVITGSNATSGVTLITAMPINNLKDIAPNQSDTITLQYEVPSGVTAFHATVYATVSDDGGNQYGKPAP